MISGSLVALVTPFNAKGQVDYKTLEQLVIWHVAQGTDGLVCCGTTGEGMTLSDEEKKEIVAKAVAIAGKKISIIACSGSANTKQSVYLTEQMLHLGASGCLIITPYYNRPTQRGCFLHFSEIAKVGLPIILYNNPIRSAIQLTVETIAELAQISGIIAIKESSGCLELIRNLRKISSIPILSGEDHLTYQTLIEGGSGSISVIGNIIPSAWKKMITFAVNGKRDVAQSIARRAAILCKVLFLETNPQCIKYAMSWLGKCREDLRLPLLPPTLEAQCRIKTALIEWALYSRLYFDRRHFNGPFFPKFQ